MVCDVVASQLPLGTQGSGNASPFLLFPILDPRYQCCGKGVTEALSPSRSVAFFSPTQLWKEKALNKSRSMQMFAYSGRRRRSFQAWMEVEVTSVRLREVPLSIEIQHRLCGNGWSTEHVHLGYRRLQLKNHAEEEETGTDAEADLHTSSGRSPARPVGS